MKELKSFVRKHNKPLQQVINRYNKNCYASTTNSSKNNEEFILKPSLQHMHSDCPSLENITGPQYFTLLFKTIFEL